jgi:hypothetical protein
MVNFPGFSPNENFALLKLFEYNVLVCDILPEGILGQDFLLKYVLKIDYRKLCLCLETMDHIFISKS